MKSIKEKAHEIGWVYSKHYDPTACKQEWCEMAARESANYVLDEIEKCVKSSSNSRLKIDTIKQIIEQLKK